MSVEREDGNVTANGTVKESIRGELMRMSISPVGPNSAILYIGISVRFYSAPWDPELP